MMQVSAAKAEPEKQANASTAGPSGDVEMKDDDETSSSGVDVSAHVGKQTGMSLPRIALTQPRFW